MKLNTIITMGIIGILSILVFTGCNLANDEYVSKLNLPSEESMEVPAFTLGQAEALKKTSVAAPTKIAVGLASLSVNYWSVGTRLALLTPVALFAIVHSTNPAPTDDGNGDMWQVHHGNFSAVLTGYPQGSEIKWTMTVSNSEVTDFVWYDGTSSTNGKTGDWTFYLLDAYPNKTSTYNFTYDVMDGDGNVRVENVQEGDINKGAYLHWTKTGDNLSMEGHDVQKDNTVLISWDKTIENGSIKNLNTSEEFCWDTKVNGHEDIACN